MSKFRLSMLDELLLIYKSSHRTNSKICDIPYQIQEFIQVNDVAPSYDQLIALVATELDLLACELMYPFYKNFLTNKISLKEYKNALFNLDTWIKIRAAASCSVRINSKSVSNFPVNSEITFEEYLVSLESTLSLLKEPQIYKDSATDAALFKIVMKERLEKIISIFEIDQK